MCLPALLTGRSVNMDVARGHACEAVWENVLCVNVFGTDWEEKLGINNTTFPASDRFFVKSNSGVSKVIYFLNIICTYS